MTLKEFIEKTKNLPMKSELCTTDGLIEKITIELFEHCPNDKSTDIPIITLE